MQKMSEHTCFTKCFVWHGVRPCTSAFCGMDVILTGSVLCMLGTSVVCCRLLVFVQSVCKVRPA